MGQLDLDGLEHEPTPAPYVAPAAVPLFEPAPFAPAVPGTFPLALDACPFCDRGAPATCEVLEENGAGVLERLTCCTTCAETP